MKKTLFLALSAAALSAHALPTYEPFTEYNSLIATQGTNFYALSNGIPMTNTSAVGWTIGSVSNAIDLGTNGLTAPSGEKWSAMYFAGAGGLVTTPTNVTGLDVYVVSNANIFTYANVENLLPGGFPGAPLAGEAITNLVENPAQPWVYTNGAHFSPNPTITGTNFGTFSYIVGNSPVLTFAQDITRPAGGVKTLFVSYLYEDVQVGQTANGNNGRYLCFLSQSNLVEGVGTLGFYQKWNTLFNTFSASVKYAAHALRYPNPLDIGAADSSSGPAPSPLSSLSLPLATPAFVVGEVILVSTNASLAGTKDTNILWLNPPTTSFGGSTPSASQIVTFPMTTVLSDIGGMVLIDRTASGALGGVGTNYLANFMLGSTWSYVTGGPEFTLQPATNTVTDPGSTLILNAAAVAAGQSVTYQWQNNNGNVNLGPGGAGGSANVSGATSSSLTLSGLGVGDSGTYSVVATAGGTSFSLTSSNSVVNVSDPGILVPPQAITANYGGTATFSATAVTTSSELTWAWFNGSTLLENGLQPDGSFAFGTQGTNNTGGTVTMTLTLSNISCADDGNYSVIVTNLANNTATSAPANLAVNDPYIAVQPPATGEFANGGTLVIPVTAAGTGLTYQWNWNNGNGGNVNNGEISGANTSALTISPASAADVGTYSVTLSGTCNGNPQITSSGTVTYIDTAPAGISVTPSALTQQVGTHLALVGTVTGGSGLIHLLVQLNGNYLTPGMQADGSFVGGPGTVFVDTGNMTGALVLSNIQVSDTGTYTIIASNAAGVVSTPATVTVVPLGQLTLSSSNLIVTRAGDGNEPLSGATGNTLYLDQFTTNGAYVNTIMVPDSGPSALVVCGGPVPSGAEETQEGYLTLSSNQQYLNFGGFCYSYPYTGGSDVTVGQQETGGSTANVRGIYALDARGIMELVYTNYGLYSGGHGFRCVYSTDGLTNFWTTGSASGGTVKYVNAGPAGISYTITTPGSGIPALGGTGATGANNGGVVLGLYGPNLIFSDNSGIGTDLSSFDGLNPFVGAPTPGPSGTALTTGQIFPGGLSYPDDFAFSPDLLTAYVASDSGGYPGVQRWDFYDSGAGSNTWNYSYLLGSDGVRGLTVYWPSNITTWGNGVTGAQIYGTTAEVSMNNVIQIVDNGQGSPATVLETAEPNTFYRGIRFGPITVPVTSTATASASSVSVGDAVDYDANVTGIYSYYFPNGAGGYNLISPVPTTYQWYFDGSPLAGVTGFSYSISNAQASNAGTYTFVVSNAAAGAVSSAPLVLSVNPFSVNSNLVGWFKFNDGSGTNAADSSVYGDNGTLTNFPGNNSEWVAGLGGFGALDFTNVELAGGTNSNNVVLVPDAPQLNFNNNLEFTISAWINSATNNQISGGAIVAKGYGAGGEEYSLDIFNNTYRVYVRNSAGTVYDVNPAVSPPVNVWSHVAATFDGNQGYLDLYVNGQLAGSTTVSPSLLLSTNPVSIGNRMSTATNGYNLPFLGEIQDVRLYNVAMSASDVYSNYLSHNLAIAALAGSPPSVSTNPPAVFISSGTLQLQLSGLANTTYRLWSTTNIALTPVTSTWTLVTSGMFNSSGTATVTDPNATSVTEYYTITQP